MNRLINIYLISFTFDHHVVIAFLTDRRMLQGTLLGLLLFLVLINDMGFENQKNNAGELITRRKNIKAANVIHLKYVDDLTLAESINLKDKLVSVPEPVRPLPDNFHAKTGHVLPKQCSQVHDQLLKVKEYAAQNSMVINQKKTKTMVFNPCIVRDFIPEFELDGQDIEMVEEMRLLGVVVRSDMKWSTNTEVMISKAYKKLWSMRRLKTMGADIGDLKDIYLKQVRCMVELAAPAWNGALTCAEKIDIERVQKTALHIMLGERYENYVDALDLVDLESLEARRRKLCLKFAIKAVNDHKHKNWFVPNSKAVSTRQYHEKYLPVFSKHKRFWKSPISYLTRLLNSDYK